MTYKTLADYLLASKEKETEVARANVIDLMAWRHNRYGDEAPEGE
jgi:hypothetical protein